MQVQEVFEQRLTEKANSLIELRKLGDVGYRELAQLMAAQPTAKQEKKIKGLRDTLLQT